MRQLLPWITATTIALLSGCRFGYTRVTPEQVEAAIRTAHVVGMVPSDAERALREIRLPEGRKLEVGSYKVDSHEIGAIVLDAKRMLYQKWNIEVSVLMDSTEHVTKIVARYSAESPL